MKCTRHWISGRVGTMSMQRSGAAATRHAFSRPWVEKAACSRSTATPQAIAAGRQRFADDLRLTLQHAPFSDLAATCAGACAGTANAPACSLTLAYRPRSSMTPERGFSFRADGPLDMRMDPTRGEPVAAWLARAGVDEMREVIATLGEERFARRVAQAIATRARARAHHPHCAAGRNRRARRAHARAGQESGDAHLSGAAHVHQ